MARNSQQIVEDVRRQAGARVPSKKLTPLRALQPLLRPYRGVILLAGLALVVAAAATLVLPAAVRGVIDHGFSAADAANIGRYFLALIAVAGMMALASATRFYLVSWIGERVTADVRSRVFSQRRSPDLLARYAPSLSTVSTTASRSSCPSIYSASG